MKMCSTRWNPRRIFSSRRIEADFSHKEYRSANLHLTRQSRTSRTYPDLRSRQLNHHVITTSITRALKAAAKCLLPKLRPINIELCGEVTDALSVWRSVRRPQRYHSRPGSVISEVSSELATSTQLASPWHGAHRGALGRWVSGQWTRPGPPAWTTIICWLHCGNIARGEEASICIRIRVCMRV